MSQMMPELYKRTRLIKKRLMERRSEVSETKVLEFLDAPFRGSNSDVGVRIDLDFYCRGDPVDCSISCISSAGVCPKLKLVHRLNVSECDADPNFYEVRRTENKNQIRGGSSYGEKT